jgi:exportin-1
MEKILNFNEPLDVNLLDMIINTFYTGNEQERQTAQKILTMFQGHPDSWMRVDTILEYSRNSNTKYFALQILESVIKYRWKVLPREQCEGIKKYIVNLIIQLSSNDTTLQREKLFLSKLDIVLVQIIKQEWPRNWENFIPEIVGASKANESLCENNMNILKLMSEEVFDFSGGQMTTAKIKELKESFNKEFSLIYQLCEYILENSQKPSLILVTLQTLLRFLNWIPLGYIFETKMIEILIFKFFPVNLFQNVCLECLTEIASLEKVGEEYNQYFEKLYVQFMPQLKNILPFETNIPNAFENGSEEQQKFIQHLSLFFSNFFKFHHNILEKEQYHGILLEGHNYLVNISLVDDLEIFKICLEYWNKLASDLYHEVPYSSFTLFLNPLLPPIPTSSRRNLYSPILSKVRDVLIKKMPKPEEVLIVEDENGEIVRETMKDSDAIALYKNMRETLIFLTHLDYDDTQNIMLAKLAKQVDGTEWSWYNLNTLCWAIGAISGAQNEEYEKRFLVTVIKDLLCLCEMKKGKDNKAVIASNIMYIVGQYPRFLRAHWKFLKTVVNKLFEFMHETHPGVQDMACDTFLKIAQKCRRKFVSIQAGETKTFIEEILENLPQIIQDLENQQVHVFYEAVGYMISSHHDPKFREQLVFKLMELPNQKWNEIISQAAINPEILKQLEISKNITNILKTNVKACFSIGPSFICQLGKIYLDLLNVYKVYSETISNAVATTGPHVTGTTLIRAMRSTKKEILKLLETFIEKTDDIQVVVQNFIPPLLAAVLGDYKLSIADARDPEVLSLMVVIIDKLQGSMIQEIPRIFDSVFGCTLEMITKNFQDYPEHRLHFFTLLRAINQHCFQAFFTIQPAQFKLVIDSIVWAFKHTERQISETGLTILLDLLKNISSSGPEVSAAFYKTYFISLLQDILYVLTDTFHKSGFTLQATILLKMFNEVESGSVNIPLWDINMIPDSTMTNQKFLREYVINLLVSAFPNLTNTQVRNFVCGLFELKDLSQFKTHLRDFLVQLKEFSGNNEDLYLEEKEKDLAKQKEEEMKRAQNIPGMIPPNQDPNWNDMND